MMSKQAYIWTTLLGLTILMTLLSTLMFGTVSYISGSDAWNAATTSLRFAMLVAFTVGLLAVGIGSYISPRLFALMQSTIALVIFIAGFVFLLVLYLTGSATVVTVDIAACLIGLGGALCLICWVHVIADDRYLEPKKILLGVSILTLIAYWALRFLPDNLMFILLIAVLVPAQMALLTAASRVDMYLLVDLNPWKHRHNYDNLLQDLFSPLVALVLAGLASPLFVGMAMRSGVSENLQYLMFVAALFISVCYFLAMFITEAELTLTPILMVGLPIALAITLLTTSFFTNLAGPLMILFGFALLVLLLLVLIPISKTIAAENYVSLALVYGILAGVFMLFNVIGTLVSGPLLATGLSDAGITAILIGLFVIAMFVTGMIVKKQEQMDFFESEDFTLLTVGPTSDDIQAGCDRIIAERGYTGDDATLITLLAHGGTVATIVEETDMAQGVVRASIKRLYDELDVGNRNELVDLLTEPEPESTDSEEEAAAEPDGSDDGESASPTGAVRKTKRVKRNYPH